jgi:hypothetical protein
VKAVIKVFLDNSSFSILETDPTKSFQRNVRKKINYSKFSSGKNENGSTKTRIPQPQQLRDCQNYINPTTPSDH